MKVAPRLSRSLGLFFSIISAALGADCWLKTDSSPPNLITQFKKVETFNSDNRNYTIDDLFTNNDFVKDEDQLNLVRGAYSTAKEILKFSDNPILELRDRKGDKVLPLIAFAEHFYYPDAITLLYELAYSGAREDQISPDLRTLIRDKLEEAFNRYKIEKDGRKFAALGETYALYWKISYQHLKNAPRIKTVTETQWELPFSLPSFELSSILEFIHKKPEDCKVAGASPVLQPSEKKQPKKKSNAFEFVNGETTSELSLRHRISTRNLQDY